GVCVSLANLAAAVSNQGALGVISAVGIGMLEKNYRKHFKESNLIALQKEIRKARSKTNGAIAVNIMYAVSDYEDLLQVALQEKIDAVIIGAGLPMTPSPNLINSFTKIILKVSSARAVKLLFQHWSEKYYRLPDAIIIEGPLAGGHLGFKKNDLIGLEPSVKFLSDIVNDAIKVINIYEQKYGMEIPVIAAGGIYSGNDMYQIMKAGAKGVKIGTRFVTTTECDVSEKFKQLYISCKKEDITIIDSPVGLPGRVITNDFVKQIQQGTTKPIKCSWKCLKTCDYKKAQFCIAQALFNAAQGNFLNGLAFIGAKGYLADKIISVKETIECIISEYLIEEKLIQKKLQLLAT
ncbi:MAG TPA: nitronate monooxygenase, partial [Bacteroidales bacterium]|nr:nitronate monooxygenase [Bacteroidales bacterium]